MMNTLDRAMELDLPLHVEYHRSSMPGTRVVTPKRWSDAGDKVLVFCHRSEGPRWMDVRHLTILQDPFAAQVPQALTDEAMLAALGPVTIHADSDGVTVTWQHGDGITSTVRKPTLHDALLVAFSS